MRHIKLFSNNWEFVTPLASSVAAEKSLQIRIKMVLDIRFV